MSNVLHESGIWHKHSVLHVRYVFLLVIAVIFHLSLLVSWRTGLWNRFTFDSTATRGQKGWDFYALYQAGSNALRGISVYETNNNLVRSVVPVSTPYRYLPLPALILGTLLNSITPVAALWVWAAFLEMLLISGCLVSWRLADTRDEGIILVAFWLLYTPYYLEIYMGQFSLVQAMLIFALGLCSRPPTDIRYDLIWLASLLWKQMTALFLPLWVIWRRWRGIVVAGLGILITTLPYFLVYPASWPIFLKNLTVLPSSQLGNLGVVQLVYTVTKAIRPDLNSLTIQGILIAWSLLVISASLASSWKAKSSPAVWHIALWTIAFFLIYQDVWEHHYVLLLPVFVMLYHAKPSPVLLILYICIASWTPYRLVDPNGLAAYDMAMRWVPLSPGWVNIAYHACKALPVVFLWFYTINQMLAIPSTLVAEPVKLLTKLNNNGNI